MSAAQALTGSIAANTVQKWLRAWHNEGVPDAVDLEILRQMLPSTPYGAGVREIKAPMVLDIDSCEGMLVRMLQKSPERRAEVSKWITHDGGGKLPVPIDAIVDAAMVGGKILNGRPAYGLNWARVVSYRLAQPEPAAKPRACEHGVAIEAICLECCSDKLPPVEPLARDMTKREHMRLELMKAVAAGLLSNPHLVERYGPVNAVAEASDVVDALLAALQEKHDDA